jgi:hypothetical protein
MHEKIFQGVQTAARSDYYFIKPDARDAATLLIDTSTPLGFA